MASEDDTLWTHILRTKYLMYHFFFFFQYVIKPRAFSVWRGIIRQWILKGACSQVGDGSNINIWSDLWLPGLAERVPRPGEGVDSRMVRKVADLNNEDGGGWNVKLVNRLFSKEVVNFILNVNCPNFVCKDKLMW